MQLKHSKTADLLLEFILPYPGEKSWRAIESYLDISELKLQLFLTEIENEKPGWLYKTVGENGMPLAVGIKEEKKAAILHFLTQGGFSEASIESNKQSQTL